MSLNFDQKLIDTKQRKIDDMGMFLNKTIDQIVSIYCRDLDREMEEIRINLTSPVENISRIDLENIVLRLPSLLYWASQGQEILALKQDIAGLLKDENFKDALAQSEEIKSSSKKNDAESKTVDDTVMELIYSGAYRKIKAKINFGTEMLQSAKKILSVSPEYANSYKGEDTTSKNTKSEKRRVF